MSYMIDYLKNNPQIIRHNNEYVAFPDYSREGIVASLNQAIAVNNQNVMDYLQVQDEWSLDDLRSPKPPFPNIFLEHTVPTKTKEQQGIPAQGVLLLTGDGTKKTNYAYALIFVGIKDYRNKFVTLSQTHLVYWAYDKQGDIIPRLKKETSIFKRIMKFVNITSAKGTNDDSVTEKLSFFESPKLIGEYSQDSQRKLADDPGVLLRSSGMTMIGALMTFSFMNCKNVSREIVRQGQEEKFYTPGDKRPLTKIYTLVIDPIKNIIRSKSGESKNLTPKAFHICRGHFKDFSHGSGLFGQHKGIYWWPMHTKGSKEYGEVIKDYKVLARI